VIEFAVKRAPGLTVEGRPGRKEGDPMWKNSLITLAAAFVFTATCLAQRDRGTFTGIVTDSSGAVVPNVQLTITQTETNAVYRAATTDAGAYTVPNLPIGPYRIEFEAPGFKKLDRSNVELSQGQVLRVDVKLEVGAVTDSVQVTAELSQVETETPRVASTMGNAQVRTVPHTFTDNDRARTIEGWVYSVLPGVIGTPQTSYINGMNSSSTKLTLLDGMPGGAQNGGIITESSPSLEAVGEFQVLTAGYTAEYGRIAQGVLSYVFKSGTNEIHGSVYGAIRNEALNANTFSNNFFGRKRDPDRKYNYAGSFGGPVYLPKLYNGKNRSFFYVTYERYNQHQFSQGVPNTAYPLQEFWAGDFSRLMKDPGYKKVGTDAMGRDIIQGTVYDPATLRQLPSGAFVADGFPGNVIPASRFSKVSQNVAKFAPRYYPTYRDPATGLYPLTQNANWPSVIASGIAQISQFNQYQLDVKGDQNISDKHKLSVGFDFNKRPVLEPRSGGLWDYSDPTGGPWAQYFYQNMHTFRWRMSEDWSISPRVFNNFGFMYNLNVNPPGDMNTGVDGAKVYGIPGVTLNNYPNLNWGGGPIYGLSYPQPFFAYVAKGYIWGYHDTLSFSKGRHFFKAGYENQNYFATGPVYDKGNSGLSLTFSAAGTNIPNSAVNSTYTGYSFASFLLGIVNNGSLGIPAPRTPHYIYHALFFQDDFKVRPNLTLNLGLRWDYDPQSFESHDRQTSWNPAKNDPLVNLPGAYDFAGKCDVCTGQRVFGKKDFNNFGPRIGFAWQALKNFTIRGAYTITYVGDDGNLGPNIVGAGSYNLAADPVYPWRGIFNWDNGIPKDKWVAPVRDLSYADTVGGATMVDPRYGTAPYVQQWNINLQKQLPGKVLIDVGYIGNKATKLRASGLMRPNQTPVSVISKYGTTLGTPVTSAADAAKYGVPYPYAGFTGTVNSALRQYPQLRANNTVSVTAPPEGMSNYNSLNVVVNRQFHQGLSVYANWVWSKSINNTDAGLMDYYNRAIEKGIASFDRPHELKVYAQYRIPVGRGRAFGSKMPKILDAVLGRWELSTVNNYFSGVPLSVGGASGISGWNGGSNRLNRAEGRLQYTPEKSTLDYASRLSNPAVNRYFDPKLFSNPPALTLGTAAPRSTQLRGWGTMAEDVGLRKEFRVGEKHVGTLRADFINAFNRKTMPNPNTTFTSPNFGYMTGAPTGNRVVQVGARLDF
jgi:hypothetical protein